MKKFIRLIAVLAAGLVFAAVFYVFFLNHVGVNHIGIAFNTGNGDLYVQSNSGWYVTSPLTRVVQLSTLPFPAHLPSQANVINTKIIKLKADKALDFVRIQGFSYNVSAQFENIMMGYAFSGQKFSFLEFVQEGGTENAPTTK